MSLSKFVSTNRTLWQRRNGHCIEARHAVGLGPERDPTRFRKGPVDPSSIWPMAIMMAPVSASARGPAASKDAARAMPRTESMRLKNFGPLPSIRNPPDTSSGAQSLDGGPSDGEPAFSPSMQVNSNPGVQQAPFARRAVHSKKLLTTNRWPTLPQLAPTDSQNWRKALRYSALRARGQYEAVVLKL